MKIEMLKPGPVDGVQRGEGEVVDTDGPTGRKLISRGYALDVTTLGDDPEKKSASKEESSKKSGSRKGRGPSRTAEGQGPERTADGESDDDENGGVADS